MQVVNNYSVYPLSQLQQAAWFLYKLAANECADKVAFAVSLDGKLDCISLQKAFNLLIELHPVLRSVYFEDNGKLFQQVNDDFTVEFDLIDSAGWSECKLKNQVSQFAKKSFNLELGQVTRLTLFSSSLTSHVLLLSTHYIACDESRILLLVDELLSIYQALQDDKVLNLPPQSASYRDYVRAEFEFLQSSTAKNLQFANGLPILELPVSHPRPLLQTFAGASSKFTILPTINAQLQEIANRYNVESSTILLAAFAILLHRYAGAEEILIGLRLGNLTPRRFDSVVGNFANLTVASALFSGDINFDDFLNQVKKAVRESVAYEEYPFGLVKQLQLNSQLSHPPRSQVSFSYNNIDKFAKLFAEDREFDILEKRTEFDLSWNILELESALLCELRYNRDLFDESVIQRLGEHLTNILTAIIANQNQKIAQIPLLSEAEEHKLLVEWNNTQRDYDLSVCLHELFEKQVEIHPEAVAVIFAEQQLTYQELNKKANQLAHYLQKQGVTQDSLVGICVERSLEMIIGLLGILKAGGAYVPIDPEYPQERLAYILEDSQVKVLLTQEKLLEKLAGFVNPILQPILLDKDWGKISDFRSDNPVNTVQPENLAYVIYTSGSTGKPKGAMNAHRGICNRLLWMQEAYKLTQSDRVLQKTPFSFDVSVWEFFWTLLNGATLVIAKPGGHRDSGYLVDIIIQQEITTLHFVPSMLQVFVENPRVAECRSLKRVICSGEALTRDLQEKFFQRLDCELHNLYGPTEAAIDVSYWCCQKESILNTVPIGRPIANTQLYILDTHLQPVPIGVLGELYIGGVGLARGYWNRPELTKEKFILNPPSNPKSERLYKTGDLARYLPDGNIEYIGRIDNQIKLRGFRIELGEIESVLLENSLVKEAVVIARDDFSNEKQLVGYVTYYQEKPKPEILRDFLKQKLPDYMVPMAFVVLPELPLTPSGKIDRRALPQPTMNCASQGENFIAPRHDTERALAKIWSDILKVPQVGVKDNFFEIGGTSIGAIYLTTAIAKEFAKELPLAAILTNPTIESLAKLLHLNSDNISNSPLVPIQPKGDKQPFFCVHPAGGHVLCYFNLARYIGSEQPFYGLQAQGFNGEEEPLNTVEEMAQVYVKAIREFQPDGPYQVGGWSFGGVVAYEVAQQLYQQGQEVSLLAILDSYVPIILNNKKTIDNQYLVGVLSRVFGGMFGLDNLVEQSEIKGLSVEEKLDYIIEKARNLKIFPPAVSRQQNRRILDVLVGTLHATYSYSRKYYPGKVTVFRAKEKHLMAPDPTLVWVELLSVMDAKDIQVVDVPGNHYTFILEPHVQVLADKLKSCVGCISVA